MGSKGSKPAVIYQDREVKVEVESDESKQYKKLLKADNQLDKIKSEISGLAPLITNGYKAQCGSSETALIIRYEGLTDTRVIADNISKLFPNHPCKAVLVETATAMFDTVNSTKEIRDAVKWEKTVLKKRIDDKVYGFELQYKVRYLDELKGRVPGFKTKETLLLVAYKSAHYVMDERPEDYPSQDQLDAITM